MVMGERGMADMGEMEMPLPDNTAPMMTGAGPFGTVAMGGMFSMLKVRKEQKRGDYTDPGWFKHPEGTVAREWTGEAPAAPRASLTGKDSGKGSMPMQNGLKDVEVQVRKPVAGSGGHENH